MLKFQDVPKIYKELVCMLPPRPIHSKKDYNSVLKIVNVLAGRKDLSRDQKDYLEALSIFVERYEEEKYSDWGKNVSALDTLRHLMDANDMSVGDLGMLLGKRSLGQAILAKRKKLTDKHIQILAKRFNLDPVLFQELEKKAGRRRGREIPGPD